MNKLEAFSTELEYIEDNKIKEFAKKCIENIPDYFFTMPASTSGKYHPSYALGEGGLLRHTKAAVKLANDLLNLEMYEKLAKSHDEIIVALMLHDSIKKGLHEATYTTTKHPLYASQFIKKIAAENGILDDFVITICLCVETHMGQWTMGVLQKPKSLEQKFVHLCDYLASRKFIEIIF